MERDRRPGLITLWASERPEQGRPLMLSEDECKHAHVRRLGVGSEVRLVDGAGLEAEGTLVRLSRRQATVEIGEVRAVAPLPPVHLLLPVADRDRMLWLAEKAAELGVTSWRPVSWHRSRSVSPRGEGMLFQGKVRARMIAALKQSGGAWLPELHPEAALAHAIAAAPDGRRVALHGAGSPMTSVPLAPPVTIALGPEGGMEPTELEQLAAANFELASLGPTVLRFETAGTVALGLARTALMPLPEETHA
ncbi:MAG TPA: RsmE family RNA methyltransferase [Gemmatimonadaceae bacterium]|nr:RsmE family RNA methyltransferase [Gemmatimonadaceae bacterium]